MEEIVVTQKEVCLPSTNQCEYVTYLSESREAQLQTIAVTVTAENVVGRGEPQPCSPTISMLIELDISFNTHACIVYVSTIHEQVQKIEFLKPQWSEMIVERLCSANSSFQLRVLCRQ